MATINTDEMLSPSKVAEMLGDVQAETIQRYCLKGDIPATKVGSNWWIDPEDAMKFKASRKRPGRPPG